MSNKIIKQDVSKDKKTKKKVNSSGGLGKGGSNGSDNENKIIPKGSKGSPSDYGKENFELLLDKYCFRKEK